MFNTCPVCKKKALPITKKINLRFHTSFLCESCGSRLILPDWANRFLVLMVFIVAYFTLAFPFELPVPKTVEMVIMMSIIVISMTLSFAVVPLVEKKNHMDV